MNSFRGGARRSLACSRRAVFGRLGASAAIAAGATELVHAVGALGLSQLGSIHEITLTASEFDWALMDDTVVRAWGYNGQMPGPELRVKEGDRLRITLRNELPVPTTIHWHGINVPNAMDGVAGLNQAPVEPGAQFVYEFDAKPAGSRWYHSHTDPALQVPIGLYGTLIIEPRSPGPTYDREYTYVMAEWDAELTPAVAAGTAKRGPGDKMMRGGELGADYFLFNGRMHGAVPPIMVRTGDRVLIRLLNAGALPHAFHMHGHSFAIVATDGNPVPQAAQVLKDTVLIGPGERYDLAFVANNPGVWMVHCHMEPHMQNGMMFLLVYEGYAPTGPAAAFYTPAAASPMSGMDMATAIPTSIAPTAAATPAVVDGPIATISAVDDRFVPNALNVAKGTTVVWTNNGQDWHDIASFDGSFASGRIAAGQSFSHTFDQIGTFRYICKHHFMQGMSGAITVV